MGTVNRIFPLNDYLHSTDTCVVRTEVLETEQVTIVAWKVGPRQEITKRSHPLGQDTWLVISGEAIYCLGGCETVRLKAGDVVVALPDEVHGVINFGAEPFIFLSVVSLANRLPETPG
ncbi:MAG: cupin domain-containing protein [Gammaproteobacteria bacterium]